MTQIFTDRVTVLLVCPPGLEQKSLYTTLNVVPSATIIARVSDLEAAVRITNLRKPDLVVVDAAIVTNDSEPILLRLKKQSQYTTLVMLVATSTQKSRWENGGADFVLESYNLNKEFPLIVRRIQSEIQARLDA